MVLIQVRAIGKYRHPLAEQIDEECNQPEALWLNNFRIYLTKVQVARLFETVKDSMSVITLDEELDEELGYSKYDYQNKETDNSRNGHSSKTMHTS